MAATSLPLGSRVQWRLLNGDPLTGSENGGVGTLVGLTNDRVTIEVIRFPAGGVERLTFKTSDVEIAPEGSTAKYRDGESIQNIDWKPHDFPDGGIILKRRWDAQGNVWMYDVRPKDNFMTITISEPDLVKMLR